MENFPLASPRPAECKNHGCHMFLGGVSFFAADPDEDYRSEDNKTVEQQAFCL